MTTPQARTGAIAQLDAVHRQGEAPRTASSPTVEQLLRGHDASKWSPSPRPLQPLGKEHDKEDDHDHTPHRKSVLAKVKEKARKWRNTLSKKKHNEDGNATPSWGVTLEDEDDEDEDPEYLGAPMYESEMAPEQYKETARQHPRAIPVISEKHILLNSVNTSTSNCDTDCPTPKVAAASPAPKTISETLVEKLAPAYATVADATNAIASKIQSLTVSNPETQAQAEAPASTPPPSLNLASKATLAPNLEVKTSEPPVPSLKAKALTPPAPASIATKERALAPSLSETSAPASAPAAVPTHYASGGEQVCDKGVSVKEFIMHKLEPGEDERVLSHVISEVISPKRIPGDASVVEKVKEAVTSLLLNDESSQRMGYHSAQNSSSHIPISTNVHEVVEEETHGRILQAN